MNIEAEFVDRLALEVMRHKARTRKEASVVRMPSDYKDAYLAFCVGTLAHLAGSSDRPHYIRGVPIEYVDNQSEPWIIV